MNLISLQRKFNKQNALLVNGISYCLCYAMFYAKENNVEWEIVLVCLRLHLW